LFPFVGVIIGSLAAALAGMVDGTAQAVLAGGVALAIQVCLEYVVARRLFSARPINPLVIIVAVMFLTAAFGFAGLLLAPLIAAAVQPVLENVAAARAAARAPAPSLGEIEERVEELSRKVAEHPADPALVSLVARLEQLVEQARTA
jgi:predicted PurR-regulated permease PerM